MREVSAVQTFKSFKPFKRLKRFERLKWFELLKRLIPRGDQAHEANRFMKVRIVIDQALCKGCELCIAFCPKKAITRSDTLNAAGYAPSSFNEQGGCNGCASCATVCPEVAIEVYRE